MSLKAKNPKEGLIKQYSKDEIPSEPAELPPGFEWCTFDLSDDQVCQEVADFLTQSYVESQTGDFRLLYTPEKLRWSCCSPGYHARYHVAVRNQKNKKLLATIVLIPKKAVLLGKNVKVAEVNFLAVHRALREKRLAQLMIQEATRLTYLYDSQIGFYTSSRSMPTPFSTSKDYFRLLDPGKALDIRMCPLPPNTTKKQFVTKNRLPDEKGITINGSIRRMEKKDITAVLKLWNKQQEKYKVRYKFSQDDLVHFLLPKQEGLVWTWVIEGTVDGKLQLTDFFSMLKSTQQCLNKEKVGHEHDACHMAGMFYYALTANELTDCLKRAMWLAKEEMGCDVFTARDTHGMPAEVLADLNFRPNDGRVHWYLTNYSLGENEVLPGDIGTILV